MSAALDTNDPPAGHRLNLRILRFLSDPGRDEPTMLAHELIAKGRLTEAVDLTARSLTSAPDDAELLLTHGVALSRTGELATAQLALMHAARSEPEWSEPWNLLAQVLFDRGRTNKARIVAERAMALGSDDPALPGIVRVGNLERRARRFAEEGERGAEDPAMLAEELIEVDRAGLAFEVTRTALLDEMDDEDLLLTHARAAGALGDLEEAISALHTASFVAPDFAEVWRLLAEAYETRGEPDRAREAAARGILAAPGDPELHALHERLEGLGETIATL